MSTQTTALEFRSPVPLPPIPDDLTIPQFMLKYQHSLRPSRPHNVPWLIEDRTGKGVFTEELLTRTHRLANALSARWNVGEDDVVCVFSPNHVDYPIVIWAVHSLGAVVTPANPSYTIEELVYQLQISQTRLIFVHSEFVKTARTAAQRAGIAEDRVVVLPASGGGKVIGTSIDELISSAQSTAFKEYHLKPGQAKSKLAFLSFSSGTTGKPKAVKIPHYSVISNVIQMAAHYKVNDACAAKKLFVPGDVSLGVLPFFHIYGLVVTMHFMFFCGASIVVIPKFSFVEFLKSIARHRITHLFVVPPQVVLMCKHPAVKDYDLTHVRYVMSGAAPLSGELVQQLRKLCPNASIGQGYGMTETSTSLTMFPPDQTIGTIGSAGKLIPGVTARVVKADGSLAGEGEQGELVVTGPSMALGYLNNEAATKETFVDGWVRTGDEVIIKNQEVFVVDRLKEIIKVRGFQVAPAELEGHLLLHPAVADVCVVGIPDDYSGEVPMAFVVIDTKFKATLGQGSGEVEKLKKAITEHVSVSKVQYKWLAGGVEFIESIPKNPSGKILRRVLRDAVKEKMKKGGRPAVQAKL
ncbi:phenylacetyl-CoA ligase [Dendrothele bispora CBS 962.96]|uniref:Phenylacetyl-CoA ligase n=1 Tax=Dendrothele bispora (strain CBS 962.96) TaxID=1314807 RepID=A0A4S8MWN4_DENBC|nr:phenylacetyl-CoA ligase [Dendrothele bispora CBS 962.96]